MYRRCGSEAVVGYWDDDITIIGRNAEDDKLKYAYDTPVKLIPEMDCIRVVSTYTTDIIQRVPKVILETYRINSTSPGSYLLEASKHFSVRTMCKCVNLVVPVRVSNFDIVLYIAEKKSQSQRIHSFGTRRISGSDKSMYRSI